MESEEMVPESGSEMVTEKTGDQWERDGEFGDNEWKVWQEEIAAGNTSESNRQYRERE